MPYNLNVKNLLAIALVSGLSGLVSANAGENNAHPPEATATETHGLYKDIPTLDPAFIDTSPADRKDGILVGELSAGGGNEKMLIKLAKEIAGGQHDKINSLLIVHKGKLVFESYYSCLLYTSPSPRDRQKSRMPSSA